MRLALVTNPHSGQNRRDATLRPRLLAALGDGALDLSPVGDDGWPEVAAELLAAQVDCVGVSGGDGTLQCLLTALAAQAPDDRWPQVALLRGGTMNTLAANLKVKGRPEALAASIVGGRTVDIPCLKAGDRVGFLFGVGVQVSFLQAYYEGATGPVAGGLLLARVVAGVPFGTRLVKRVLAPQEFTVHVDGQPWSVDAWKAVGASTVPSLGLGFQTCPHTPAPGKLEAYGFGGMGWAIVRNLHRMRMGWGLVGPDAPQAVAESVVIEADYDLPYMVDGDLFTAGRRLEVGVAGTVRFRLP